MNARKLSDAFLRFQALMTVIVSCASLSLYAQVATQALSLDQGWNAIYLSVSPTVAADDLFAQWPVHSVSAYRSSELLRTEQVAAGLSGESAAVAPFGIWTREELAASTLRYVPADTVLVCFNTNSAAFHVNVHGSPAAPRIAWHTTSAGVGCYNYVGVRLNAPVLPSDYFAGADIGTPAFLKLGGRSEATPTVYNPQRGSVPWMLTDGDAILVRAEKRSDWSGPLHISPVNGIDFGRDSMLSAVNIRNDGVVAKTVAFAFVPSADGLVQPELLWRDSSTALSTNSWEVLSAPVVKTLNTGETWRVSVAIDRTQFGAAAAGSRCGGSLVIEEQAGTCMRVALPLSVTAGDVSADEGKAPGTWPAGLWVGTIELSSVSRWVNDTARVDDLPSGGRMKLRLLLHVGDDGSTHLLQRVIIAGRANTDGSYSQHLFGPAATIPAEYDVASRISCAALPASLGLLAPAGGAFLGSTEQPLVFNYTIAGNDSSNPFYHPLHPHFDGLRADFKTPAPSGDDFTNYIGAVKPERFSISGALRLTFDENAGAAWDPEETVTGAVRWTYSGIRREGAIHAGGTFVLTRIASNGTIHE
ncbi:MAG: hypothetical protein PHO37_00445 [Kiritimatiellae bacterium]|nr:hypothetical protein [Kiritimatiellia bacterium]